MIRSYVRDGAEIYRRRSPPSAPRPTCRGLPAGRRAGRGADDPRLRAWSTWSTTSPSPPASSRRAARALRAGAPILCDAQMVASGVTRRRLPADNEVVCTLRDPRVPALAARLGTTRTAAALELWRDRLDGAVVAIGNAPTALFRLLEMIDAGAPRPAAVLGIPVGFIGAAESKEALAAHRTWSTWSSAAGAAAARSPRRRSTRSRARTSDRPASRRGPGGCTASGSAPATPSW